MFRAGRWLCSRAASLTQSLAHQQSSVHESKLFLLTASSSSSLYQQHALGATPGPAPAGCTHLDAGFPLPGVHTIGERVAILQPAVSRAEEPFSQPTSSTFPLTEHFQDTYLHPDLRDRGRESSSTGLGSSSSTPSLEQGVTPTPRLDPVQGTAPASSSSGSMDLSPERLQEMQASYNQQQQARWQSWEPPDPALFRAQVEAELSAVESAAERAVQQAQQLLETRQADIIPGLGPLLRAWAAPVKEELDRELVKARTYLAPSGPGAAKAQGQGQDMPTSQMVLWPVALALEPARLASLAVSATLAAVVNRGMAGSPYPSDAPQRRGVSAVTLAMRVGQRVQEELQVQALRDVLAQGRARGLSSRGRGGRGKAQAGQPSVAVERLRKMERLLREAEELGMRPSGRGTPRQRLHGSIAYTLRTLGNTLPWLERQGGATAAAAGGAGRSALAVLGDWDPEMLVQVGGELAGMVLQHARVPLPTGLSRLRMELGSEPAFRRESVATEETYRGGDVRVQGVVTAHPDLLNALLEAAGNVDWLLLSTQLQPMLLRPLPWVSHKEGCFLLRGAPLVRTRDATHLEALDVAQASGQLDPLFRALDALGSTPWRVNTRVLEIARTLWDGSKGPVPEGLLPSRAPIPAPRPLTSWGLPSPQQEGASDAGAPPTDRHCTPFLRGCREGLASGQLLFTAGPLMPSEQRQFKAAKEAALEAAANAVSIASATAMRLDQAQRMADAGTPFYLPHSVDFRGRAYPIPPILNHTGDDLSRGLLVFGEGRPLGDKGFDWLLCQMAACYGGVSKRPTMERIEFARTTCVPRLAALAADPLSPEGSWWMKGDKPWQLLAAALEVHAAMACPGGPSAYVSHLPVHQDGSCNGLQHYAALGRDMAGGAAVNLVPGPAPADVYSTVCAAVNTRVQAAATAGRSEAAKVLARNGGVVDRALVKQSVMTSVYGVTLVGARGQISNRLTERGWTNQTEVFQVSSYLAKETLSAVGQVFSKAKLVMDWLATCATVVARTGAPVSWFSPVGFPVVQPYRSDSKTTTVTTRMQHLNVANSTGATDVDKRKQRSAFPPNYIHCLDSAHMMMTADACNKANITFASVHDSFWTHAATVDNMNIILREQFVMLHEKPLLQGLVRDLEAQCPEAAGQLPDVPEVGTLKLEDVKKSEYFFN